ncbi:MAG: type I 3-dehydroquinate dehydratase [Nitrospirae bacterium]|nr:type I 3-dehydroquinate dehydratase [Nitrospirota bacterium]
MKGLLRFNRPGIAASVSDSDIPLLKDDQLKSIDLIELRIDLFEDLSLDHIKGVFKKAEGFNKPLIATVRDVKEGGAKEIADSDRLNIYEAIADRASMIDVEIRSSILRDVKEVCKKGNTLLIASFHDFNTTPERDEIIEIINTARAAGADIVKIATRVENEKHIRLLTEITLMEYGKGIITIGMGQKGLITRVVFPVLGSLFTFASVGAPKAPGQIPVTELREIINRLYG